MTICEDYFLDVKFRGITDVNNIDPSIEVVSPTTELPLYPDVVGKPDNSVEGLMEAVVAANEARNDVWPGWILEKYGAPEKFADQPAWLAAKILEEQKMNNRSSLADGASWLVSMDHPLDLCKAISDHYWPKNKNVTRFVEKVDFEDAVGEAVVESLKEVFRHKWQHLTARPVEKLKAIGLDMQGLEPYPHPGHPSWMAGHGGVAGATAKACVDLLGLNSLDAEDVRGGCLSFAMFRTFSFMHVAQENIDGFIVGEHVSRNIGRT